MVLFRPHFYFFFFFKTPTSDRIYKIISWNELARPVMGTIFLVKSLVYIPSPDNNSLEIVCN